MRRILIANRGEIAVRIIRTCRALGIETVLAASQADLQSVPARLADRTVCIGPARPADSYLKVETIVHAARATQSDAIHPGYGFTLGARDARTPVRIRRRHLHSAGRPPRRSMRSGTSCAPERRPRRPTCR